MRAYAQRGSYALASDGTLVDVIEVEQRTPERCYLVRQVPCQACGHTNEPVWVAYGDVHRLPATWRPVHFKDEHHAQEYKAVYAVEDEPVERRTQYRVDL